MTEVERLAAEVREQNELFEAGEVEGAFWLGQKHRLEQIKATDPSLSQTAIGKLIGKGRDWVRGVLGWDAGILASPFAGPRGENREASTARKVLGERPGDVAPQIAEALKRPEVAEQVARDLSNAELAGVVETASRVGWERGRAKRREADDRDHGPSIGDVAAETGETAEEVQESLVESWADTPTLRACKRVRELHAHVAHYGLVFSGGDTEEGRLEEPDWLERMLRAEAELAEVRAALQERIRDRGGAVREARL